MSEEITEPDMASIIDELNNSNAKGEFGLDTNFIKLHKESLLCSITHIINYQLNSLFHQLGRARLHQF